MLARFVKSPDAAPPPAPRLSRLTKTSWKLRACLSRPVFEPVIFSLLPQRKLKETLMPSSQLNCLLPCAPATFSQNLDKKSSPLLPQASRCALVVANNMRDASAELDTTRLYWPQSLVPPPTCSRFSTSSSQRKSFRPPFSKTLRKEEPCGYGCLIKV